MDRSSRDEDIGHDGGLDDQTAVSSSSSIDQPEPSFMFVPSPSRLGKAPSAGHPRVRSFLMRNARRQKAWTTGASGAATATAGAAGAFEDIKNTGGEGGSDSSRARSQEWAVSANEGANPALDSHYYSIPPTQSATSERPRTNSLDQQYDLAQSTMATWFLCPLCLRLTSRVPDAVCWQCSTVRRDSSARPRVASNWLSSVSQGLIDPFNSIAVRLDRRTSELLSHCEYPFFIARSYDCFIS
ncbi:hypothetical protein BDY21DRAFT_155150 [Lineolata rhizophorae]|uniref:Uncharacterized protein n=1 Tax=Lineolata rhizophorae TaxID=578093 RepID=A0A6A6NLT4_9PEZI|nr:hypothetical protein BDY21DRAFT_155150 [Lineolata rhizophorae]